MNCSSFKRQTADWLDRRLSLERSQEMASHRDGCESCAREALAESQLRRSWHEGSAGMPVVDVWPRLLTRLEAQEPSRLRSFQPKAFRLPRWALGGAVLVAALGVFGLQPLREKLGSEHHGSAVAINKTTPGQQEASMPPGKAIPWTELGDVSQVDPIVNDPLGANMETVWTNIKTAGK